MDLNIKARQSSLTQLTIVSLEENFSVRSLYYKAFFKFFIDEKKVLLSVSNPTILTILLNIC